MGIQVSNLSEEKIKNIMINEYNIYPNNILEIDRGTANIFKITAKENSYILKEFNPKRSLESIEKEIRIINFLKDKDFKVPKYINTKSNECYIKKENRIIILQEFINGYTMENNTVDKNEKIIESATIIGKLTKQLKEYPKLDEEDFINNNFSKKSIENRITKMKALINEINEDNIYKEKITQDLNDKIKISTELFEKFDFDIIRKMTITNAHGDYSIQQLIYNDESETTVIDFETAKSLPIAWEIIRSYSYIDKEAKDGNLNIETLVQYFQEFFKYVKLNEYDLKYAGHIYLIQLIGSTFGYKEYNNDYSQKKLLDFAIFRTNLCRFLYENLDIISEKLLTILT